MVTGKARRSARTEYLKLVGAGKKQPKDVAKVFRDASTNPFAGSAKREIEFRRSLGFKDRQVYDAARREQVLIYRQFTQMSGVK